MLEPLVESRLARSSRQLLAVAVLASVVVIAGAPSSAAATCDGVQVPCAIGDSGPGGGIVFYDAGSAQTWGRYLEFAPGGWSGSLRDPKAPWCDKGKRGYAKKLATMTVIGSGAANTKTIIRACGKSTAAGMAAAYSGGGKADWFLPSKDEMKAMIARPELLDGYVSYSWTSSQDPLEATYAIGFMLPENLPLDYANKSIKERVRPVRAF